jgi:hypothetical protein
MTEWQTPPDTAPEGRRTTDAAVSTAQQAEEARYAAFGHGCLDQHKEQATTSKG